MYCAIDTFSVRWTIAAGLAIGFAAICRPIILPFVLFFPILLFFKQRRVDKRNIGLTLLFVIILFIPILPVTITNITKGNEFVLISTQGGANFYVGNNAKADGVTVVAPGPNRRVGKYNDNIWTSSVDEAELRTGRTMTQSDVSSYWFNETIHYITSSPVNAAKLFFKKFYLVFHGQEIINIRSLYYAGEYSWLIKPFLWDFGLRFPSGLLFPLMFLGIIIAVLYRKPIALPVAYILSIALLIAAFFACARFRQPLIPIAGIFAVFAVTFGRSILRTKQIIWCAGVAVFLGIIFNAGGDMDSKANEAQSQSLVAQAYMDKKNPAAAIPYLEKSIESMPDNLSVYEITAQAYIQTSQPEKAAALLQRGIAAYPSYAPFHAGLGEIAFQKNDKKSAKQHFLTAFNYSPAYEFVLGRLTELYLSEQAYDSALIYCQKLSDMKGGTDRKLLRQIETLRLYLQERFQQK
jgi:tetratricopeptide (TPR) repeat protein